MCSPWQNSKNNVCLNDGYWQESTALEICTIGPNINHDRDATMPRWKRVWGCDKNWSEGVKSSSSTELLASLIVIQKDKLWGGKITCQVGRKFRKKIKISYLLGHNSTSLRTPGIHKLEMLVPPVIHKHIQCMFVAATRVHGNKVLPSALKLQNLPPHFTGNFFCKCTDKTQSTTVLKRQKMSLALGEKL